jgi:hypothetical protein
LFYARFSPLPFVFVFDAAKLFGSLQGVYKNQSAGSGAGLELAGRMRRLFFAE